MALAVVGSLALHAAAVAGALLGTAPRLPFVSFEVAEVATGPDEGEVPVPPLDEVPVREPAKPEEKPPPEKNKPDEDAPAEPAPEPAAAVKEEEAPPGEDDDGEAVVIAEPPESAPAKGEQGGEGEGGPPDQPSAAPLAEDAGLAWKSLRAAGSPLGEHVPGDARMAVWLDMAALRRTPLRTEIAETLRVLAGLHALVGWAEIDLLEDVDELVIASPNPYVPGLLYLVARLRPGKAAAGAAGAPAEARLAALGEKARRLEVAPGVWAFAPAEVDKPPYVIAAVAPAVIGVFPARRAAKLLAPGEGPASRPAPAGGKFTELLRGEGPAARREDRPEILLAGQGVEKLLPMIEWGPGFAPAPESLRVAFDVVVGAEIHAEMRFAGAAEAATARAAWAKMLDELRGSLLLTMLGVRPLLDRVDVWADGPALRGSVELPPDEAVRVLRAIRPLLVGEAE